MKIKLSHRNSIEQVLPLRDGIQKVRRALRARLSLLRSNLPRAERTAHLRTEFFRLRVALAILLSVAASVAASDLPVRPLASKGALVFSDDFARAELGAAWQSGTPTFTVSDGVLKGRQTRAEHGAVAGATLPLRDGNVILELKFRFEGAKSIHVARDDKTFTGVHDGHISRIVIFPNKITVYDDKEGIMRNDIYALRKSTDPKDKAESQRLATGRSQSFPLTLDAKRWYRFGLEIVGDQLRATIDDRPVAYLKSSGLTHSKKDDLRLQVWGMEGDGLIDDLRVWAVAPTSVK